MCGLKYWVILCCHACLPTFTIRLMKSSSRAWLPTLIVVQNRQKRERILIFTQRERIRGGWGRDGEMRAQAGGWLGEEKKRKNSINAGAEDWLGLKCLMLDSCPSPSSFSHLVQSVFFSLNSTWQKRNGRQEREMEKMGRTRGDNNVQQNGLL